METEVQEYIRAVPVFSHPYAMHCIAAWLQHEPETLKYKTYHHFGCHHHLWAVILNELCSWKNTVHPFLCECVMQLDTAHGPGCNVFISRFPLVPCVQQLHAKEKKTAWKEKTKLIKCNRGVRIHITFQSQKICNYTAYSTHTTKYSSSSVLKNQSCALLGFFFLTYGMTNIWIMITQF